jgi:hypothetical protein
MTAAELCEGIEWEPFSGEHWRGWRATWRGQINGVAYAFSDFYDEQTPATESAFVRLLGQALRRIG